MKPFLRVYSYLFHPLFIPLFATFSFFAIYPTFHSKTTISLILFQIAIVTIFIPICFYYLLKSLGKAESIMLHNVSERRLPLLIMAILLFVMIKRSVTIEVYPELYFFFLGSLASTLIALAFSLLNVKASLHMMGIGSLTIFILTLSIFYGFNLIYPIAALFFITGLIASSRLEMKAHDGIELVVGYLVGVVPQIIIGYVYL